MKKVGKLTEARMVYPAEPKTYPLVSDSLFENKVKGYPSKGIKGGTAAAAKMAARKKLKEDDLPMNQTPEASKMTTNSPKRATPKSVQVGGPYDLTAEGNDDWIQGAEADIERRGTKGKCTPITKKGCTGKAKALAKTFKKMGKKRDAEVVSKDERKKNEGSGGDAHMQRQADALSKKGADNPGSPLHRKIQNLDTKINAKSKDAAARIRARESKSYSTWSPFRAKNERTLSEKEVYPSSDGGSEYVAGEIGPGRQNSLAKIAAIEARNDAKKKAEAAKKTENSKLESTTAKPIRQARARAQAGKPIKKGTAKMVASDPGQDLDTAKKAGAKL